MDFFEHQDRARRRSGRLVALFVAAVVCIIVALYLIVTAVLPFTGLATASSGAQAAAAGSGADAYQWNWWRWDVFAVVAGAVILIVLIGSAYKILALRGGGSVVAESLGGRLVGRDTSDPDERKLLNVVDEMAIASGAATPAVYLLEGEAGINAFAAGLSVDDAVIGVTRGAVERLTRDELQGVIAHEFSHILNGDMALNLKLIGLIHGILLLALLGYSVLRGVAYSSAGSSRSRGKGGGGAAILAILAVALALIVVGGIGMLFGNLIKAAVSRQREFLADAAAVQFTRNPHGIAGALTRIGGYKQNARLAASGANELSHLFFGQAVNAWLGGLTATHPPLPERIRRIDPAAKLEPAEDQSQREPRSAAGAQVSDQVHQLAGQAGFSASAQVQRSAVEQIGQPSSEHLNYAHELLGSIPKLLRDATHEAFEARAVVYLLLLDVKPEVRRQQMQALQAHADERTFQALRRLVDRCGDAIDRAGRLVLLDLAIPALRSMSQTQRRAFGENAQRLIRADERVTLFEWMLGRTLERHLEAGSGRGGPRRERRGKTVNRLKPVAGSVSATLSALAKVGHASDAERRAAFDAGASQLQAELELRYDPDVKLQAVDAALDELDRLTPRLKRRAVTAFAACMAYDREVVGHEAELMRAVADGLGCPMPPLLPGQSLV